MVKFNRILLFILLGIFLSQKVNALTSSSYLIANAAITSFDYDIASEYLIKNNYLDSNVNESSKKIISFVNSRKFEEANLIAQNIIKSDVSHADAWIVLLIHAKLNNDLDIFTKFNSLINKEEYKVINYVFFQEGKINNNISISKNLYNLVQQINSTNIDFRQNIDYYFFYLNLALILNTKFNEIYFIKGQIYQELKKYFKAEETYNRIQLSHELYIEGQKNIAIIFNQSNEFDKAEKLLIKLINNHEADNSLLVLLADIYRSNRKYLKALKYYNLLLKNFNIDNELLWRVYYKKGICYEKLNQWDYAEENLLKSLNIEPDQPQVLNYLAYGWIEKNLNIDKSITMLNKAVKKNPDSHYILDSLAWAYYKKNNFLKAVEIMEKVIEIAPGEAISLDHLGDIYFSLGRKREAYFMWKQAKDLSLPEDNIAESIKLKIDNYDAG